MRRRGQGGLTLLVLDGPFANLELRRRSERAGEHTHRRPDRREAVEQLRPVLRDAHAAVGRRQCRHVRVLVERDPAVEVARPWQPDLERVRPGAGRHSAVTPAVRCERAPSGRLEPTRPCRRAARASRSASRACPTQTTRSGRRSRSSPRATRLNRVLSGTNVRRPRRAGGPASSFSTAARGVAAATSTPTSCWPSTKYVLVPGVAP